MSSKGPLIEPDVLRKKASGVLAGSRPASSTWLAKFVICGACQRRITKAGLINREPFVTIAWLVARGLIPRPSAVAFLEHPVWLATWERSWGPAVREHFRTQSQRELIETAMDKLVVRWLEESPG